MKKILFTLCFGIALLGFTACANTMKVTNTVDTKEKTLAEQKAQTLIQQVRTGDIKAYEQLAACYQDGTGVKQSGFNMLTMYMLLCDRTDLKLSSMAEKMDKNTPMYLWAKIMDQPRFASTPKETADKLRNDFPVDAMCYDAIYMLETTDDTTAAKQLIIEAANKGCEFADIFLLFWYNETKDKVNSELQLHKCSKKFPIFYNILGEMEYDKAYAAMTTTPNPQALKLYKQAIQYYQYADQHGMLLRKGAKQLDKIYQTLEDKWNIPYDENEKNRLATLSQKVKTTD